MMTSLCTCVFLYVCALVLRFSSFALWNREARTQPWQHNGDQVGREFFFWYIFFEKRKTRNACCWCWSDAGDCCCCFRSFNVLLRCPDSFLLQPSPTLVLLPSTRLPFLFFSFFLLFFFFPHFSLFLLLSPWVMSNLRVLYI